MSKALEIAEWRQKAVDYRAQAAAASNSGNRKVLEALAHEADAIADAIEDRERRGKLPVGD